MKKNLITIFFLLNIVVSIQAQNADFLDTLNIDALTMNEKLLLYSTLKKDSVFPTFMNGIIGFGSGSFAQSDYLSGTIGFIGDTIGFGFLLFVYAVDSFRMISLDTNTLNFLAGTGVVCIILSKAYQLLIPSLFADIQNKKIASKIFGY